MSPQVSQRWNVISFFSLAPLANCELLPPPSKSLRRLCLYGDDYRFGRSFRPSLCIES